MFNTFWGLKPPKTTKQQQKIITFLYLKNGFASSRWDSVPYRKLKNYFPGGHSPPQQVRKVRFVLLGVRWDDCGLTLYCRC